MADKNATHHFFAHSTNCTNKSDWQSFTDHCIGVAELSRAFGASFGAEGYAYAAGLLHDLGKYTLLFQQRLEGAPVRVDHATWGAKMAIELYGQNNGLLLAYAVAGHHAGLANGDHGQKRTALADRLAAALPPLQPGWREALPLPEKIALPEAFQPCVDRPFFQLAFLIRMLYSCVVDADFIDTDNFYRQVEGCALRHKRSAQPDLTTLREKLNARLASFSTEGHVNQLRAGILQHVRQQSQKEPGLFSLTVPTGGGKTLASLAFALDHAIAHKMQRVIYVIPYTSIVEQTATVFRQTFGTLGEEAVLEHHSAFVDAPQMQGNARDKLRQATENWDAPIIVTTAVQFFESLFADRSSRCRKLHNIANSVIILDEAQTLPYKLLRPCVTAIDELALNYHCSLVLCTATQPALNAETGFQGGLNNVRELAPDPHGLFQQLDRVTICHLGTLDDEALADRMRQHEQVLCIVNNRRHARALYDAIGTMEGARHLTTLMCAQHRRVILSDIRQRLQDGKPCRVVSTSLIEAGVDVDFPVVLRAQAGLDSIAQAAGRCNREGRRPKAESEVGVFAVANTNWSPPPELQQYAQVFEEIVRNHTDNLLGPDAVRCYFEQVYWQKGLEQLDGHALLPTLQASRPDSLPFETIAKKFCMIESNMQPVIVAYDDTARKALRDLRHATHVGALARKLQPYLVQIPAKGFSELRQVGAIQPVLTSIFGEQFMELVHTKLYDEQTGLHWDNPAFLRAESCVA